MNKKEYKFIKIKKLSGSIGAIIENVKLNNELTDEIFNEIYDAYQNRGSAIKKKEDTHKMAESNKAFAHFRW